MFDHTHTHTERHTRSLVAGIGEAWLSLPRLLSHPLLLMLMLMLMLMLLLLPLLLLLLPSPSPLSRRLGCGLSWIADDWVMVKASSSQGPQ